MLYAQMQDKTSVLLMLRKTNKQRKAKCKLTKQLLWPSKVNKPHISDITSLGSTITLSRKSGLKNKQMDMLCGAWVVPLEK